MSLAGVNYQVIDVLEMMAVNKATGATFFQGNMDKSDLAEKVTGIDIFAGIGAGKVCHLNSRKDVTLNATISEFDLDAIAALNGVAIDKTTTGTYYFNASFAITGLAATVTSATRIMAVRDSVTGDCLKIVTGTPAAINEVKVAGTALTFYTGYTPTTCLVTYEAPAAGGKDNYTIILNSKSFPNNFEILLHTVAFDMNTEKIVADINIDLYACALEGDWTLSFDMSKNIQLPFNLSVLVPATLPNGTVNTAGDIGKMTVTEK